MKLTKQKIFKLALTAIIVCLMVIFPIDAYEPAFELTRYMVGVLCIEVTLLILLAFIWIIE